ncbi:ankyrin repeat domain-containing protein 40 isoform X1 [Tribolium castaneum]|uniref:Tankyrase-2-like Protein n=1 Tax=Tribolium castaneum TaxID=7070 RepID=A0A139WD99_TRICA|nr:PREDICTED: ankyrin repeat domain-containing protein 40 isoform X1 [Tribolium castaneum]KYB25929.1 Tankyrase-2-like Protein [Tribolium castaneum]|eukprot:XP_966427.1 PREDICTED: ankyrin repeat domain-containing protein 40 isoform X1 [Tribolium castaneum]
MSSILEEKLREAACIGDIEAVLALLSQNLDINAKNSVNGWTALHWAAKRGNSQVADILLSHGANPKIQNLKGETPGNLCTNPETLALLGEDPSQAPLDDAKFTPNYLKNAPVNGQVDIGKLRGKPDFSAMPTTALPACLNDDLVLNVRIAGSSDPDFIEVEIPRWKLTYLNLFKICCEELEVLESQVERIRKLPSTRLRKDSDVKRLDNFQSLELVLKMPLGSDKPNNCYQSISTCKNQTILY